MSETVTAATPAANHPKALLLDVEGTTSPVSLVYEQLFPYARKHLEPYLRANLGDPDVQADLTLLAAENVPDREVGQQSGCPILDAPLRQGWEEQRPGWEEQISAATAYLHWLMDQDRKSTALKSLQGKIWKSGFENGELKGTVFPTSPPPSPDGARKPKSPSTPLAASKPSSFSSATPPPAT